MVLHNGCLLDQRKNGVAVAKGDRADFHEFCRDIVERRGIQPSQGSDAKQTGTHGERHCEPSQAQRGGNLDRKGAAPPALHGRPGNKADRHCPEQIHPAQRDNGGENREQHLDKVSEMFLPVVERDAQDSADDDGIEAPQQGLGAGERAVGLKRRRRG